MKQLDGKVVAITGAASGIGRALALDLAARGAHLALADRDSAGLAQTASLVHIARPGANTMTVALDVAEREAVFAFAHQVVHHFGHADIVFNNAGVAVSQTVADLEIADFEWIVDINFWGVVHGTQAFLPYLSTRPEAAIVNTSSVFGLIAVPTQSAYNATKFAVRGFTEALRHELAGTSVHVMCVHPGGIKTDIVRNARLYVGPDGGRDHARAIRSFDNVARTTPEAAAAKMLSDLLKGRGRCLIGADAHLLDWLVRLLPQRYWSVLGGLLALRR